MSAVIDITGLSKSFGNTRALDGLQLSVETGEVHGFLGPNGAGKSTTLRILLGLIRADAGRASVLDYVRVRSLPGGGRADGLPAPGHRLTGGKM